ncbi:MAG: hypothetical protein M3Z31_02225 [Pseudomonadota bacterium]|nr:hypothetical protein [Pseudomonadota bacterium]
MDYADIGVLCARLQALYGRSASIELVENASAGIEAVLEIAYATRRIA